MIQHEFIAIDEGRATLLHISERDPSANWCVPIGQPQARDMQLVGGNKILIGHHLGYTEFDIATGRVVKEFASLEGVTAVRRQPNGHTIIAGVDIADIVGQCFQPVSGSENKSGETETGKMHCPTTKTGGTRCPTKLKGVVVLDLDANDREVHRAIFPDDYVRLIRQTNDGTYLMCCNDRIREGSRDGSYLREFPVEGFYHAWKAVRLANGNLLVSAGYGAFLVELDPSGKIVRKFGGKESVPAEVNPFFYAMFQLLQNGNIVLANWQGHGEGHGAKGVQLLEFNPRAEIVWSRNKAEMISSLQGVLVLDGLDTSKLHDEREGVMQPLT
jgi:hypothetical protein